MQKSQFELRFLALILQVQGLSSRKNDFLSISLSKNGFWSSSFSSSSKNGCCALFYILGFHVPAGQDNAFSFQKEGFSLQRVGSGCSTGPLIMRILTVANLVLATTSMYFAAMSITLVVASTPCLESMCASIFQAFRLETHPFFRLFGIVSSTSMAFVSCKKNTINKYKNDSKTLKN